MSAVRERKGKSEGGSPGLRKEAYLHLTSRRLTTVTLARALGVSPATAFRVVEALRRSGVKVESMKEGREWFFAVRDEDEVAGAWRKDPLLRLVGFARGSRRAGESVDDAVYARK